MDTLLKLASLKLSLFSFAHGLSLLTVSRAKSFCNYNFNKELNPDTKDERDRSFTCHVEGYIREL